jgi:hypothetical protein
LQSYAPGQTGSFQLIDDDNNSSPGYADNGGAQEVRIIVTQ